MSEPKKKPLDIDELNRLYSEGETCDKELFSEQRSNILISSGEHFSKKHSKWWARIREARTLTNDQKIRVTKNHTHRIIRTYINNIISMAPGVVPTPNDPKDLQHVKAAQLNKSVWEYAKEKHSMRMRVQSWAKDFIEIGEVFNEIFWDPTKGTLIGYEQEVDETGEPMFGEDGQPMPSEKAVFTGDLTFRTIIPANVVRAAEAKTIAESRFLCVREMVKVSDLKHMIGEDEEKEKLLTESPDETFYVFDNSRQNYYKTNNQLMLRKFYFRPSAEFPNGWYAFATESGILFEGELPFGIYPIIYGGFDEISTTPRHRSIIKQLRPIQSEIDRASSKMAETQITIGDDKVILQNGSKVTTGPHLPGVRTMFVTGMAPTIMPGRTGEQYLPYVQSCISELYQVANIDEDAAEKSASADPYENLYRSLRDKKKFSMYAEKFENFLVENCRTYLDLARHYFDENMLIPAIGKAEYVNISEFKNSSPLCTRVKLEPMSDDINEMMGRHLTFNHILQYVGNQLSKDDIGKFLRNMPFANNDEMLDDFTLDYDTAMNVILALDRGQPVMPFKSDNPEYVLKRLGARMQKPDFRLLPPQIQMNYDKTKSLYEQLLAQKAQELKMAESQFIPSGGAMIKVDYYVPDPTNSARSVRATVPAESVDWLIKMLSAQGSAQEQLMGQKPQMQMDLAQMIANQGMPQRQLIPLPQANQGRPL